MALADVVVNDVDSVGVKRIAKGASTTIKYRIFPVPIGPSGFDPQPFCNANDGTAATVNLNVPADVNASATSLTFNDCFLEQSVTFSSSTPGNYPITVSSVTDSGVGTYHVLPANFNLHVSNVVESVSPPNGAMDVPVSDDIKATFSGAISGNTINGNAFTLVGPDGPDADTNPDPVNASRSLSADGKTATLNPDNNLADNTNYTATLEGGFDPLSNVIVDTNGNPLLADYSWSFKTGVSNTAPQVSVTGVNNPSYEIGSEPTSGCSVTDAEDGSAATADPVIDRSALNSFGLGTVTVTCSYEDTGGLSDSDTVSYTIVDTIDPTASHQLSAAANGNGWHKADFTVTLNGSDSGSDVSEIRYTINSGTEQVASGSSTQISVDTEGIKDISYYSVDNAGNESEVGSVTVRLDKTAPTISATLNPRNPAASGWYNISTGAPKASYTCGDTLSGLDGTCPGDFTFGEGNNLSHSETVSDQAGNQSTAAANNIKVDLTKPTLNPTVSPNPVVLGGIATASAGASDSLSGVDTSSCDSVNTNTIGANQSVNCSATDKAGNTDTKATTYSVGGSFVGWLQPVDGDGSATGTLNIGKVGRTFPIKWQLKDSSGALISDTTAQLLVGTMSGGQKSVTCGSWTVSNQNVLEESLTGNTSLRYDATSDQFIYNYKAPSTTGCYAFAIKNADGITIKQANFNFTE